MSADAIGMEHAARTEPAVFFACDALIVAAKALRSYLYSGTLSCAVSCTNIPSCVGHFWDTSYEKTKRSPSIGEQRRAAKSLILLFSVAAGFAGIRKENNF